MPSRNRVKTYVENSYYHLYNRGVEKRVIFADDEDYRVFLSLLKRYLNDKPTRDNKGREYENLHEKIELLAFCLMPNHFHLLVYQNDEKAITSFMQPVCTSYTRYFNKKHKRVGPLFQDRYKASLINRDDYLLHISRYIHRNPKDYAGWEYSSYRYYLGHKKAGWLRNKKITRLFSSRWEYVRFMADFDDYQGSLGDINSELANK